jgi:branched-subunit amino acid transport protein
MASSGTLWLVIIGMGVITFGLRLGSLLLAERLPVSDVTRAFMRFIPVAALTAIIFLEVLMPDGKLNLSPLENARLLAAVAAVGVALRFRNALLTIAAGMLSLWVLQLLIR